MVEINRKFWQGRKVLLTGHTGFQGAWLSMWLKHIEADLLGISIDYPTTPCLFKMSTLDKDIRSIQGDILDRDLLKKTFASFQPEIVIHLAAQSLLSRSLQDPFGTYSVNVLGSANLIEVARATPSVKGILCVTSDKCYSPRADAPGYREIDPLGGKDPYSLSKAATELIIQGYQEVLNLEGGSKCPRMGLASARVGNVIGGGDWARNRLIPDIVEAMTKGKKILLRNPASVRPWQFVLEPLKGYLLLAEQLWENGLKFSSPWNFGPEIKECKTTAWVAETLIKIWGGEAAWENVEKPEYPEEPILRLDSTKALEKLGWKNKLNLEEALAWIAEWYRACMDGGDVKEITLSQIKRYQALS